ncbi:MAG: hypothetical protein FIA92_01660 [Chloroflexi bacterium]|nr:hypothetical protein [Chloroflexota bacterium]
MRPSRAVARAALTAALALGALPGLVGSHGPSPDRPIDAAAFRQIFLATTGDPTPAGPVLPDAAARSASVIGAFDALSVPGDAPSEPVAASSDRARPEVPTAKAASSWKKPRYTLSGFASFYDHGTTAMRDVPRGTTIVICGAGGCIERVVSDYGPSKKGGRIIDMYRPDFFKICGCGWWSGTTEVTIKVY